MSNRRAHPWLTGLAMALALAAWAQRSAPSAAETRLPPCAPALSVTDVQPRFRFERDCGIDLHRLERVAAEATRTAHRARLPGSQRVAFAKAANSMFEAMPEQTFETVASITLAFVAQSAQTDEADFVALAHAWTERYALLRWRERVLRTDDPLEPRVDAAIAALDFDTAAKLVAAELAEPGAPDDLIAARSFDAGIVEWLRLSPKRALVFVRVAHVLRPEDLAVTELYGDLLFEARLFEQAQPVYESLALRYQVLAHGKPERWRPRFAAALAKLGRLYAALSLPSDAEMADLRALGIYWGLAREQPGRFGPTVADLLGSLGALYRDADQPSDAIDAYREALKLERALVRHDERGYTADLATTLNDLGVLYASAHRVDEARGAYVEALEIQRSLVRQNALAYESALARTLNNAGNLYSDAGELAQAEQAYDEALAIRRKLARESPARAAPDVARTLTNLGVLYRRQGRPSQAEHAYREALRTLASFEVGAPVAVGAERARTLNNLGVLLSKTGRLQEAEGVFRRAAALYETLTKKQPALYRSDYVRVLGNLAKLYDQTGRKREAKAISKAMEKLQRDAPTSS
ncbi:tetratricopeptide repeat protein [Trinickia diaoshuihuensis]|uniref:tetratricopeptide repeat protein n=1 Tax=Trinickia diaoshuihuensis TaxID=2292265 RepID=UPI000E235231|nr:tetratricopeptide repeat protein [Trinickia diaoshuihuensis]